MNGIDSSVELKARARQILLGRYSQVVPVHLLFLIFSAMLGGGNLGLSTRASTPRLVISVAIMLIGAVLSGLLQFGLCLYYMNTCCNYPTGSGDLFRGFGFRDERPVRISVRLTLMLAACVLPALILYALYSASGLIVFMPLASLALCVGLTAYVIYYLGLSQCYYLILDFPDKKLEEIIVLSRWLMRGQRMRLFYIHASFIPLYILGAIPCGVGLLWVLPYREATLACFHLNLTGAAAAGN